MNKDWSTLRRWAGLAGAAALLAFVGAVVTRGPAPRPERSPVFLSRASGQAEAAGETNDQRFGDVSLTGPYVTTTDPASASPSIGQLRPVPPVVDDKPLPELEVRENEQSPRATFGDSVLQAPAGPASPSQAMPGLLQNFAGLTFDNNGAGWPPDTNGDVGPNHFVQVVNTSIGIYNKSGTQLAAFTFNALFAGSGTVCDNNNRGDPVALYDAQANRWIVADFAWANGSIDSGPHYECIAASQTSDPTGAWWRYALQADATGPSLLNDYPKLAVWPDGIYMSANMFACSNNCNPLSSPFSGVRVWALNRSDLYSGAALRAVVFNTGSAYFSLLPSNFRGAAPPAGAPNYFVGNDLGVTALDVFKFHVDWTTPISSTFTGPVQIGEAGYTAPPATVPQLSGPGLDSLGDRLMMQNQYRNLAGSESLWLAHTAGNPTGVRWYQLNVSGGTVNTTPAQQATYAPADGLYRWMPSLAVDKFGNMAVGYSAASSGQFASIRYAGRLVTDTASTLGQSEALLIAGGGAQTTPCGGSCSNRWGDYSAMTVDPLDDCTFWYTTEYYASTGDNWQTRIGSFRYPACGAQPAPRTNTYLPVILVNSAQGSGQWSTVMQEGFEGSWPAPGWQISDPNFGEYLWGKRNCRASTGGFSGWAIGGGSQGQNLACGTTYADNMNSWMVYGPFSLADATAAKLDVQLWLNTEPDYDQACVMASTDNLNFYTSNAGTCFSGSSGGNFVPVTLDLSDVLTLGNLAGRPQVWVGVLFRSDPSVDFPEGAHVDDLLLSKCVGGTCPGTSGPALVGTLRAQTAALTRP